MKKIINAVYIYLFVLLCILNMNTPGSAEDTYRFEINSAYFNRKTDNIKLNFIAPGGIVYFSKINLNDYPDAEAAFYQEAGYFKANAVLGKAELGDGKADIKGIGTELKTVMPFAPIFITLSFEKINSEGDMTNYSPDKGYLFLDVENNSTSFGSSLGCYIIDGMAIAVNGKFEDKKNNFKFKYDSEWFSETTKTHTGGINFKYVILSGSETSLNITGIYNFISSEKEGKDKSITLKNHLYAIDSDFYFIPPLGIGGGFEFNKGDDKEKAGKTYRMRAILFLSTRLGVLSEFGIFKAREKTENAKTITLLAACRI